MLSFRTIGAIGRTYRHIARYRQILRVLFKYGFDELVDVLHIEQYVEIGMKLIQRTRADQLEALSRAERLRLALVELGPAFIKMGQILSTRADVLPPDWIRELATLQDAVPPVSFDAVRQVLETELDGPLDRFFAQIDEQAVAAASLGQVHCARLRDGRPAAVKVQRPGVREVISVDLEIMQHLAQLMERHLAEARLHRPTKIVAEFARTLERELDYTIEAANMERFAVQFEARDEIHVPQVYRDMTTTRVLTMEYITGTKVSHVDRLVQQGLDPALIAARGAELTLQQLFEHNFFHADPHPGNIMVLPGNVVCYLDYGMMGRIDRETRDNFADLMAAMVRRDEYTVARALLTLTAWDVEPDMRVLQADLADIMGQYFYRPLREVDFGRLLQQLLDISASHQLRLQSDLYLMLKVLSTIEGLGRQLDPEFDIVARITPFVRRLVARRYAPRHMYAQLSETAVELSSLLRVLPRDFQGLLRQLRQGELGIAFEHRNLEPLLSTLDTISNRIAFAIVLASLVIGSSLVVLAGIPPTWHGIPLIGLAGFVVAGMMGFWLLWSILRRGSL